MIIIDYKELYLTNFLVYGANENKIDLKSGMTAIRGPVGSGKSTIIEGLTFAKFGQAFRDIKKIASIRNTSNKGKTIVKLVLDRTDAQGTNEYTIIRELGASGSAKLTILKNGVTLPKEAGGTQSMLEKEIFGFDRQVFEVVISFNSMLSTCFIDMKPDDKRKVFESIISLQIDKFKELNNKALREAKTQYTISESDFRKANRDVDEIRDVIFKLENEVKVNAEEFRLQASELIPDIEIATADVEARKTAYNDFLAKLHALKEEASTDLLNEIETDLVYRKGIRSTRHDILSLKNDVQKKQIEVDKFKSELDVAQTAFDLLVDPNPEINTLEGQKRALTKESMQIDAQVNQYEKELKKIIDEGHAAKVGVPCTKCGKPTTEDEIDELKKSLREKYNVLKKEKTAQEAISKSKNDEIQEIDAKLKALYSEDEKYQSDRSALSIVVTYHKNATRDYLIAKKTYDDAATKLSDYTDDFDNLDVIIDELETRKSVVMTKISEFSSQRSSLPMMKQSVTDAETMLTSLVTKKEDLEIQASKYDNQDTESIVIMRNRAKECEALLIDSRSDVSKYSDEIRLCEFISKMYDDGGIRSIVLNLFVPELNKDIEKNIKTFGIPFSIVFDESMNFTFSSTYGMAPEYGSLSQGQVRKINFAVTMAFRDFVTRMGDFKISSMFFDEVLDISTDDETIQEMLFMVKSKLSEIRSMFVVSHRSKEFTDMFDNFIDISNDGTYSTIYQHSQIASRY